MSDPELFPDPVDQKTKLYGPDGRRTKAVPKQSPNDVGFATPNAGGESDDD